MRKKWLPETPVSYILAFPIRSKKIILAWKVQLKACTDYAQKQGLEIVGSFGGTWESAKTDERKEFQRMLTFVKNRGKKVSHIIVYSHERFSRTGENAIWLGKKLRESGIRIVAATQPIDTSGPAGVFQQNILFLFSQFENDLRREKIMASMVEKLSKGGWMGKFPIGYKAIHEKRLQAPTAR